MKIGIVRHFKVDYKPRKMMNSLDFEKYVEDYDKCGVIKSQVDLKGYKFDKCYCSDLERAVITANNFFDGEIEKTDLLREVRMYPVFKTSLRIPAFIWSICSRISWKRNGKSQLETADQTKKRAKEFVDKLDLNSNENILIVAHGFFLLTLISELKSRGFKGEIPKRMKNACLYILEDN